MRCATRGSPMTCAEQVCREPIFVLSLLDQRALASLRRGSRFEIARGRPWPPSSSISTCAGACERRRSRWRRRSRRCRSHPSKWCRCLACWLFVTDSVCNVCIQCVYGYVQTCIHVLHLLCAKVEMHTYRRAFVSYIHMCTCLPTRTHLLRPIG